MDASGTYAASRLQRRAIMPQSRASPKRLTEAGGAAGRAAVAMTAKALKAEGIGDVCQVSYVGTVEDGKPVLCRAKVRFEWTLLGEGFRGVVQQTCVAAQALHGCHQVPRVPWEAKLPLLVACLPTAIAQRRPLPAMAKHAEVKCHGLGLAKEFDGPLEKVVATVGGKRQEMLKCAIVAGDTYLCHAGGVLAIGGLVPIELPSGERPPKQPRSGVLYRMRPVAHSEQLSKIMAVAHYRAEHLAAAREQRQPDWDEARLLFNMDVLTWQKPRNVFVFWSYKTAEGAWHAEVTETPFKGLCA